MNRQKVPITVPGWIDGGKSGKMSLKLLIFLTWVFYIAQRHTTDKLWFFCMIYSGTLAMCAWLYRKEHTRKVMLDPLDEPPEEKKK